MLTRTLESTHSALQPAKRVSNANSGSRFVSSLTSTTNCISWVLYCITFSERFWIEKNRARWAFQKKTPTSLHVLALKNPTMNDRKASAVTEVAQQRLLARAAPVVNEGRIFTTGTTGASGADMMGYCRCARS